MPHWVTCLFLKCGQDLTLPGRARMFRVFSLRVQVHPPACSRSLSPCPPAASLLRLHQRPGASSFLQVWEGGRQEAGLRMFISISFLSVVPSAEHHCAFLGGPIHTALCLSMLFSLWWWWHWMTLDEKDDDIALPLGPLSRWWWTDSVCATASCLFHYKF